MLIKNRAGEKRTGTNRPVFIRHPVRYLMALLAEGWQRLEQHWEVNPGFVAAAAAGSLGLLLTAAMLFNAGWGWLSETPLAEEQIAESPDFGESYVAEAGLGESGLDESDLGDSSAVEILAMRARNQNSYRTGEDDDSGDQSDPFPESRTPSRAMIGRRDNDFAADDANNADETIETAVPAQIAKARSLSQRADSFDDDEAAEVNTDRTAQEPETVPENVTGTLPVHEPNVFENDDDAAPDEPVSRRPLPEMQVASQPQVLKPLEMDDAEDGSITDNDQLAGTETKSPSAEPARLKVAGEPDIAGSDSRLAKSVETDDQVDDDRRERSQSIDLVRVPAENPAPRADIRWKQQIPKSAAASAPPEIAARQSRPVETKIFAAPKARSAPVVKENRAPREASAVPLLRLAISGPPSVGIGQPCQFEIRVTNTGSVPAHDLVVSAELPEGLVHDVAQSLEQRIAKLAPGATYRALLRLRGEAVGEKTIRAEVETGDRAALNLSTRVKVTPASEAATTIDTSDRCCAPLLR